MFATLIFYSRTPFNDKKCNFVHVLYIMSFGI